MLRTAITNELRLLWRAHQRVGLDGKMCLYSLEGNRFWPAKPPVVQFWFGPDQVEAAVELFLAQYNNGLFPYTSLLLNPVVHHEVGVNEYVPAGSGVVWATALTIANIPADKMARVSSIGVAASHVARGENERSGIKLLGFAPAAQMVAPDGTVPGSRQLYDVADIDGEPYWPYYLLSGVGYLSNTGVYSTAEFSALVGVDGNVALSDAALDTVIAAHTVPVARIEEAALCWERYDRHPTLYTRFGNDVANLDKNLKLYEYCGRDFQLFDSTGPDAVKIATTEGGGGGFEFLVHGLIPRGAIVLLAGTGGTGKSSLAHKLCCLVATDWAEDEQPLWIGQKVNKALSKGICIYFAGEDGPAIINARNEIFDPGKRAQRLMFQSTNFTSPKGDKISFADFLARLKEMPEVPLLVVDPARKYLTGDEDDAAVVSEFFEAIEKFAHERNTSVIVVHHLSKGAKPQSARDVLDELRGSQVFIDRPRVVIGMFREGPKTIVGLGKCNIPPSLGMVTEERVFAHNPKTLDLVQLPGAEGVRNAYIPIPDAEE